MKILYDALNFFISGYEESVGALRAISNIVCLWPSAKPTIRQNIRFALVLIMISMATPVPPFLGLVLNDHDFNTVIEILVSTIIIAIIVFFKLFAMWYYRQGKYLYFL